MRTLIAIGACLWMGAPLAAAQDEAARQFSSRVGAPVSEAIELLNSDAYAAALSKLDAVLAGGDLTPYELANIQKMRGSVFYELDNLGGAITAFEAAMSSGGLTMAEKDELFAQIAQLKIATGQPVQGAQMLEDWAARGGALTPRHINMLTQAWVQAEDYQRALPWAKKWFAAASPKERKHFDLMNFIYSQLNMLKAQADIVKQMISRWPDDHKLWENWASLLSQGGQDKDAFEVNRLMYMAGLFTSEADILKLVQYYGFFDVPYGGAKLLEKEMNAGRVKESEDTLKRLSNLWRQAREYERAIPVLRRAATLSGSKDTYAELAEALIKQGECGPAETAFGAAIEKGYGAGKPWMLIGTCRYEAAQNHPKPSCDLTAQERAGSDRNAAQDHAAKAFAKVTSPSRLRADAQKWVSFISAEQKAVEDRCTFIKDLRKTQCFDDIDQAYKNVIFTGGKFVLRDESCGEFKPDFDKKYRRSAGLDEG